jgi:hypothetical protein
MEVLSTTKGETMKLFFRYAIYIYLTLTVATALAQTPPLPRPPTPTIAIPPLEQSKSEPFCIGCLPFEPKAHKAQLAKLVGNTYVGELRKALYMQDGVHQFESRAHFDNCDFGNSIAYVQALLAEVGHKVELAKIAAGKGDAAGKETRIREAFFALGQALHGTQDFYAHSNYVETHVGAVKKIQEVKVVPIWTAVGADQVKVLEKGGLKSGYVYWGFPQNCSTKSPSHAELAKDSEKTVSGKIRVTHLQNISQFTAAQFLARRASIDLVAYAFDQWPLLKEMNGEVVAFEVLLENRNLK